MPRRTTNIRSQFEPVEPRRHLAAYGNPWPEASRLTFSFAPDSTRLVGLTSQLFATLDATLPREQWQRQIVQALQRWAVHTDLNLGYRPDSGAIFGTPGFTMGDPRFGDIRIGAHEMDLDVLAVSVPPDPARSGTLTGDVFFNSAYRFDGAPYDLMTVMLHEAGHVFGLDHSTDPASPMFERFNNPVSSLTPADIASIRALYGARSQDRFDAQGPNETFGDARPIDRPNNFDGTTPLAVFGDLTTSGDVDYFKFQTPSDDNGYTGLIRVTLQSAGISLLQPSLRVLDSNGVVVGQASSTSWLGDRLEVTFNVQSDDTDFTIRIDSDAQDSLAVGRYAAFVTFEARDVVPDQTLTQVALGPHELLDAEAIRLLFLNASGTFLNADGGSDNTPAEAAQPAFDPNGWVGSVEVIASIEATGDIDYYEFELPSASVVTFSVWSVDPRGLAPSLVVVNEQGQTISSRTIVNGNRTVTVQLENPTPNQPLFVGVGGVGTGNYFLTIDRSTPLASLQTFASGSSRLPGSPRLPRQDTLYVAESQLMHFLLTTQSHAIASARLTVQIINAQTGTVVFSLSGRQGSSVSGPAVLLTPGEYHVRYLASGPARRDLVAFAADSKSRSLLRGATPAAEGGPVVRDSGIDLPFTLQGSTLSGPIGPSSRDPLLRPRYSHPTQSGTRLYPNGVASVERILWVVGVVL
jgi:hypothetical protein